MIRELTELYDIDLPQSFMVGDRDFDIQAGRRAGTRTVFVGRSHPDADFAAPSLSDAVDLILHHEENKERQGGLNG
jgi:D-glycero-D-manno-heptose 1,7-bisphosphate phosphatase